MRVALYEIEHSDDVPTEVAIDEAIEIAKEYCGADAPGLRQRRPRRGRARAGAGEPVSRLARDLRAARGDHRELGERARRDDERAAELRREAADLAAEAVEEANRRMREAEPADG